MRKFLIAISGALALSGCSSHSSGYARADGVPVDPLHQQTTLAQYKGEGATAAAQANRGGPYGVLSGSERKPLWSTPAWRGMVTFKRSSDSAS